MHTSLVGSSSCWTGCCQCHSRSKMSSTMASKMCYSPGRPGSSLPSAPSARPPLRSPQCSALKYLLQTDRAIPGSESRASRSLCFLDACPRRPDSSEKAPGKLDQAIPLVHVIDMAALRSTEYILGRRSCFLLSYSSCILRATSMADDESC
ncbi:hypothetical protein HYPSUDRAFT_739306 [Hypholoma sublateritium FD-334 SS-4]|uniref:Uncharacterized protein n=1 Tax=Hypholoma sublateritium (strain FD-334 SS-4) TaxID=945553 RepID=A0A0D2NXT9_HYPSF|nr:hypothetical protein HYPSUDRAFT_739306 [Hypholoma sublateritium FD-334 SS-4]